jgi:hypothetical protein
MTILHEIENISIYTYSLGVAFSNGMIAIFLHHTAVKKSAVYDEDLHLSLLEAIALITTGAIFCP